MVQRNDPMLRLHVETSRYGWELRRPIYEPYPTYPTYDSRPSTADQAARVAELPEYLGLATVLTLASSRYEAAPALPSSLQKELTAAKAFAANARSNWTPWYSDDLRELQYGLRTLAGRVFAAIADRPERLKDLGWSEYEQVRHVWRDARFDEWRQHRWVAPPAETLFGESVAVERLVIASPAEIIFLVTGPLGVAFAIMVVTQWLASQAEHQRIDIINKKLAAEAAEIVVQRLRSREIPIPPDVIAAVVQNARIAPVPLPPIASVNIDVGAG